MISSLTHKYGEVERSLAQRLEAYGEEREIDIYPSAPVELPDDGALSPQGQNLYPALTSMNRTWHQIYSATQSSASFRSDSLQTIEIDSKKGGGGSLGSSPQISLDSGASSRSNTPRI